MRGCPWPADRLWVTVAASPEGWQSEALLVPDAPTAVQYDRDEYQANTKRLSWLLHAFQISHSAFTSLSEDQDPCDRVRVINSFSSAQRNLTSHRISVCSVGLLAGPSSSPNISRARHSLIIDASL
jgi:hypothetical protein